MASKWLILIESNTSGTGRLFCDRARDMNLRPLVLARDPGRYPYIAADEVESVAVDTTDHAAILAVCGQLKDEIAGVTSSSEYFVGTAAEIARSLGRPHPDPVATNMCRNKYRQSSCLQKHTIGKADFGVAYTTAAAVQVAGTIGYPVVVKPTSGTGSICVSRCENGQEVAAAADHILSDALSLLGLPSRNAVLVEEYLAGAEYSVEILDQTIVGITRKYLGPEPFFVEIGHDFPAPLDNGAYASIGGTALRAVRVLGLGWGPAHVELRITQAGPKIIEVNPRLAGGMIPRLVQEASGVDMISHVVARATGATRAVNPLRAEAASIRFLVAPRRGRLTGFDGTASAQALLHVVEVGTTCQVGHEIEIFHSFKDRLAYVITRAGEPDLAASAADRALRVLHARIASPFRAEPMVSADV